MAKRKVDKTTEESGAKCARSAPASLVAFLQGSGKRFDLWGQTGVGKLTVLRAVAADQGYDLVELEPGSRPCEDDQDVTACKGKKPKKVL